MENNQAHILIVDDEILNLEIVSEYLSDDYQISTAENGVIAWEMLEKSPNDFDVILLDRMMPNMNGMEVLEKIKQHPILQHCPVIFQTAKASASDIAEGINAGAYYYLTKPFDENVLLSVTKTAVEDRLRYKEILDNLEQTKLTMGMLTSARFEFKTLDEARSIASLVSNACPEPAGIVMGLTELMINAVEHGNLGITYAEKSILNEQGTWVDEVNTRLQLAKNINKAVSINFLRNADYIEITVIDQGEGFDWKDYMDFDPDRVMDNHGRGIAVANKLSFSAVEYKGKGNEVCATLNLS
ncbi:MAG: response regulator [Methylococcaceae bacterium]|nr:response regulator [Methylococcaceae bacterium]